MIKGGSEKRKKTNRNKETAKQGNKKRTKDRNAKSKMEGKASEERNRIQKEEQA